MRRGSLTKTAHHAAGGRFAATTAAECAANFSALKHFFPCTETSGTTVTDVSGGVILGGAVEGLSNSNGIITFTSSGLSTMTGNNWVVPATKKVLILFIGKPNTAYTFSMGSVAAAGDTTNKFIRANNTTGAGISRVGTGGGVAALNAGITSLLAGDGTLAGYSLAIDWAATSSNSMVQYDFDETTVSARNNIDIGTTMSAGLTTAFTGTTGVIGAASNPGNIQVWHFTTLPAVAEIKAALAWTTYYKSISPYFSWVYPGFRSRS